MNQSTKLVLYVLKMRLTSAKPSCIFCHKAPRDMTCNESIKTFLRNSRVKPQLGLKFICHFQCLRDGFLIFSFLQPASLFKKINFLFPTECNKKCGSKIANLEHEPSPRLRRLLTRSKIPNYNYHNL